jgi:hypothetical protein
MKTLTSMTLLFVTLIIPGCGRSGAVVSGTVKFTDGKPLNIGSVIFDNGKFSFVGIIKEDGTYTAGVDKMEKIPPGTYRVYLQGTTLPQWNGKVPEQTDSETVLDDTEFVPRVAAKYTSPETSGLTLEVQSGGKQTFDMTVEKP